MKKIIFILVLLLGFLFVTGAMAEMDINTFNQKIAELQTRFIDGQYWTCYCWDNFDITQTTVDFDATPKSTRPSDEGNCGGAYGCNHNTTNSCKCGGYYVYIGNGKWYREAGQCHGYALMLCREVFGSDPYYVSPDDWEDTDIDHIQPGDIIRESVGHTLFITGVDNNNVYYTDCNWTGHCQVQWNASKNKDSISAIELKHNEKGIIVVDESYLTNPLVFNALWYREHYSADPAINAMDLEGIKQHWLNSGIPLNYQSSTVFDLNTYMNDPDNGDLRTAFGTDRKKYIEHYVNIGYNENRKSAPNFDVRIYKNNYQDLIDAFHGNIGAYTRHYLNNGYYEGRSATHRFQLYYHTTSGLHVDYTHGAQVGTLRLPNLKKDDNYEEYWASSRTGKEVTASTIFTNEDFDSNGDVTIVKKTRYRFDVNGLLDGEENGNVLNWGTFDLYINGVQTRFDDYDAYDLIAEGSTYEIKDIKAADGKRYIGVSSGSLTGTITGKTKIVLDFRTLYRFDVNGWLDGANNNNITDWGTFDLYVNGNQKRDDDYDAYDLYPYGSTYEIKDVKAADGKRFAGAANGSSLTGTIKKETKVYLDFRTLYRFDVNGMLDGVDNKNITDWGTFDLYVNGELKRNDDYDAYDQIAYGFVYEIKDIKAAAGKKYVGPTVVSGTVTEFTRVHLDFRTVYNVTYNANDGVNAPQGQEKVYGIDLPLSSDVPTKEGYTFLWWEDATDTRYYPGNSYTVNAPLNLSAVWGEYGSEMQNGAGRVILDGDYEIRTTLNTDYFIDINGTAVPAEQATDINLYKKAESLGASDVWTVTYLNNGFYKIVQKDTNMALSIADDSVEYRAELQAVSYSGKASQQWSISAAYTGDVRTGFRLVSRSSGLSIDLQGGELANKANIHMWEANNSGAQSWVFIPACRWRTISDGRYILHSALDGGLELAVGDDDVMAWNEDESFHTAALSQNNAFDVEYLGDGYYKLTNVATEKALSVEETNTHFYENVCVSDYGELKSQQWAIVEDNGGYVLMARCSGYGLRTEGTDNGANVIQIGHHTQTDEHWQFTHAEYTVQFDLNGGNGNSGNLTKYYKGDLDLSGVVPTKGYSVLQGWRDDEGTVYNPDGFYTTDTETTLTAIWADPDFVLPDGTVTIEDEAFYGGAFTFVVLPDATEQISSLAFAACENLQYIYIPNDEVSIAADAFQNDSGITLICHEGSNAYEFANRHGIEVKVTE